MFQFSPTQPQPCRRLRLIGWMSVAHWNGSEFRLGETGDGALDAEFEDDEEEELRNIAQASVVNATAHEFGDMVQRVENICMPRMLEREAAIKEKKRARLIKNFAKQLAA